MTRNRIRVTGLSHSVTLEGVLYWGKSLVIHILVSTENLLMWPMSHCKKAESESLDSSIDFLHYFTLFVYASK